MTIRLCFFLRSLTILVLGTTSCTVAVEEWLISAEDGAKLRVYPESERQRVRQHLETYGRQFLAGAQIVGFAHKKNREGDQRSEFISNNWQQLVQDPTGAIEHPMTKAIGGVLEGLRVPRAAWPNIEFRLYELNTPEKKGGSLHK